MNNRAHSLKHLALVLASITVLLIPIALGPLFWQGPLNWAAKASRAKKAAERTT